MRKFLKQEGWKLVAGEYPGGTNHLLHPLNVVDTDLARDDSPDPRRHSLGELIPDLVALRDRDLFIGEAKLNYDNDDLLKLTFLLGERRHHLIAALQAFNSNRPVLGLLPLKTLVMHPVLVFLADTDAPPPPQGFSYLRIVNRREAYFEGFLG